MNETPRRDRLRRWAIFAAVFVIVVIAVSTCASGEEALARNFLRALLRALR